MKIKTNSVWPSFLIKRDSHFDRYIFFNENINFFSIVLYISCKYYFFMFMITIKLSWETSLVFSPLPRTLLNFLLLRFWNHDVIFSFHDSHT